MAFNSNGQISYFVLDSLTSGSKYGLEIIEYISQKTGGSFIMKKPTLYSCLTRMEKKGLVSSSYWGESELGGKRHYYSITEAGRENLETLAKEFENVTFDTEETEETVSSQEKVQYTNAALLEKAEEKSQQDDKQEDSPVFLQQGNLFDIVKQPTQQIDSSENDEEDDVAENQIDIFNMAPIAPENTLESLEEAQKQFESTEVEEPEEISQPVEEIKDDAKLLGDDEKVELSQFQEEQNQILYNSSNDFKKYRKKKSFSENQIEMTVAYETEEDEQLQRDRIAELKRSFLEAKNNNFQQPVYRDQPSTPAAVTATQQTESTTETEEDEVKDDAVLITGRLDSTEVPVQKKIAPTNIEVNIYDDNLPAPNRNSNLEPTYKDMMAKLFERKKEKQTKEIQPQAPITETFETEAATGSFSTYEHLKQHYQNYGIEFKEHKKSSVERNHNTNLLQFITSAFLLLFAGVGSAVFYAIIAATDNVFAKTSFMFYTLPAIFAVVVLYMLLKWKCFKSKKAVLLYNALANWAIFVLGTIVILIVNVICGMQAENMALYLTSLILPSLGLFLAFPINYHIKKFLYKKYAK